MSIHLEKKIGKQSNNKDQQKQKSRIFSPVVLFHDKAYRCSTKLQMCLHKKRVYERLESNGKHWLEFIQLSPEMTAPSPGKKARRRGNLPKAVTAILRGWLSQHKLHPYPTEEEKASLADETRLNVNQVNNWFINARRRILQPMLEEEG